MHSRNSDFDSRKNTIMKELSKPAGVYEDRSPKGSVDVEIVDLVDQINSIDGLVTTSSCSGRISVFVEGITNTESLMLSQSSGKEDDAASNPRPSRQSARKSGKGSGGRWLFVSHNPLPNTDNESSDNFLKKFELRDQSARERVSLDDAASVRFVHFKFEPMIVHVLASSLAHASKILTVAQQAGFRESGAMHLPHSKSAASPSPLGVARHTDQIMVAIRTTGLAFDNIIGVVTEMEFSALQHQAEYYSIVPESYLRTLVSIANHKFSINTERKQRFSKLLEEAFAPSLANETALESRNLRKERKRREGLLRQKEVRQRRLADDPSQQDESEQPEGSGFDLGDVIQ